MTPSRSPAQRANEPLDEERRDTIPAPPPSAATLDGEIEAPVESRGHNTIPAPARVPAVPAVPVGDDVARFDDEPATDRAPALVGQLDAV